MTYSRKVILELIEHNLKIIRFFKSMFLVLGTFFAGFWIGTDHPFKAIIALIFVLIVNPDKTNNDLIELYKKEVFKTK